MSSPVYTGPYTANLELEQRRRELRAARFEPLAGALQDTWKMLFAVQELNQAKAKSRAEALTEMMKMYGNDAPQDLKDQWGGAVEVAAGARKPFLPRTPDGHVIGPSADALLDPEERAILNNMTSEERHKHFLIKGGLLAKPESENLLKYRVDTLKEKEKHDAAMEAIGWANVGARGPKGDSATSDFTIDPNTNEIVRAKPGDRVYTRGDIKIWQGKNRDAMRSRKDAIDIKVKKRALEEDKGFARDFGEVISTARTLPAKSPQREALVRTAWQMLQQHQLMKGNIIGDYPGQAKAWNLLDTLTGAADTILTPLKPGPTPSGPVKGGVKSDEEQANEYLSGGR